MIEGPGAGLLEGAVAEAYDAVAESALVEKLEVGADVGRQRRVPPPRTTGQMNRWHSSQPGLE